MLSLLGQVNGIRHKRCAHATVRSTSYYTLLCIMQKHKPGESLNVTCAKKISIDENPSSLISLSRRRFITRTASVWSATNDTAEPSRTVVPWLSGWTRGRFRGHDSIPTLEAQASEFRSRPWTSFISVGRTGGWPNISLSVLVTCLNGRHETEPRVSTTLPLFCLQCNRVQVHYTGGPMPIRVVFWNQFLQPADRRAPLTRLRQRIM